MTDDQSFVSIHTLTNRFEGDLLMQALAGEEIPTILRSFEETPYDGLFIPQRGWGQLLVPEPLASRARRIIQPLLDHLESRGPYSNPADIDPQLWESLRRADPDLVCRNAEVGYDAERGVYRVPFLSRELHCFPGEERIEPREPLPCNLQDFQSYLVVLHYLLEARPASLVGKWISEREIPGGELFFRGPHRFPTGSLVRCFGSRKDLFREVSQRLQGVPVSMGDVAFRYSVLPRIPLVLVLWEGDDEFEPAFHFRFDAGVSRQVKSLDTLWAMVNVVSSCLESLARELTESTE